MVISEHAYKRQQQRSIPDSCIDVILKYGIPVQKQGNAIEYRIPKRDKPKILKEFKYTLKLLEEASHKAVLISGDTIITVYNIIN